MNWSYHSWYSRSGQAGITNIVVSKKHGGENMIRSMTGYSSVREQIGDAIVSLEIKGLNHRTYDVHYHSSRSLAMLEVPIREYIQNNIRRGRIEIYLRVHGGLFPQDQVRPNIEIAKHYLEAAKEIATQLNLTFQPSVDFLLDQSGVLELEEPDLNPKQAWELLEPLVDRAIKTMIDMKLNEGARLKTELISILNRIAESNRDIMNLRGLVMDEYREKMLARIDEWRNSMDLDHNRVLQEVAFYTDRSDIQEETIRLDSHVQQFREIIDSNDETGGYIAVGRRLDFLCQEMFREANTIGSKSSTIEIIRLVLDLKSSIEQLREQVQNVE